MSHDTTARIERNGSGLPGCNERGTVFVSGNGPLETGSYALHGQSDRKAGSQSHDWKFWHRRDSDLISLRLFYGNEILDRSPSGVAFIVDRVAIALEKDQQRGREGHWAYDHGRQAATARVLRNERALLVRLECEAA
jgi:hypothetical protein